MVIKSMRKLTRIRNNGTIQLQFFHRCIVGATESKFVNGLPRFSRITFRLTKSIRKIDVLEVLMLLLVVFSNFVYFAQSRGSFDAIAFLLRASRSRMPFFNSELIQGAFFYYSASTLEWSMKVNNIEKFRFPISPQNIRIIRAVTSPVLLSDIVTKTLSIKIFKISVRNG